MAMKYRSTTSTNNSSNRSSKTNLFSPNPIIRQQKQQQRRNQQQQQSNTLNNNNYFPLKRNRKNYKQYNHYFYNDNTNSSNRNSLAHAIFCLSISIFSIGIVLACHVYTFYKLGDGTSASTHTTAFHRSKNNIEMIVNHYKNKQNLQHQQLLNKKDNHNHLNSKLLVLEENNNNDGRNDMNKRLGGMHHHRENEEEEEEILIKQREDDDEEEVVMEDKLDNKEEEEENIEEGEEINIKDYFLATTSLNDEYWGGTSINSNNAIESGDGDSDSVASSYAEVPYCIECYPTIQTQKHGQVKIANPFLLSVWIYLLPTSIDKDKHRIIVTSRQNNDNNGDYGGIQLSIKTTNNNGDTKEKGIYRYLSLEYSNRNNKYHVKDGTIIYNYYTSLKSEHVSIPLEIWTHVGLIIYSPDGDGDDAINDNKATNANKTMNVNLFLNGMLVLDSNTLENQQMIKKSNNEHHRNTPSTTRTRIGQSFQGTNGLEGHIAMLSLWMGITTIQNKNKTQNEIVLKTYFQSFQRAIYRSELNHDEILQLSKNGLAKSPSLLYTFYNNQVDEDDPHQRVRPLIELVRNLQNGYIYKGIQYLCTANDCNNNDNKLHRGGYRYIEYIDGTNDNIYNIPQQLNQQIRKKAQTKRRNKSKNKNLSHVRSIHIRDALKRTWDAYTKYAYGEDELLPITKIGHNNWNNIGLMIIENIDTLYIFGLVNDYNKAKDWINLHSPFIEQNNNKKNNIIISVSQSCTRLLGSLITTYELTSQSLFLKQAEVLSNILLNAFITSPTGLPYSYTTLDINGRSFFDQGWLKFGSTSINTNENNLLKLADLGIYALEFRYLSKRLNKSIYSKSSLKVYDIISSTNGLLPSLIQNKNSNNYNNNNNNNHLYEIYTLNQGNVNYYDNLLKIYIQGGYVEHKYRRIYDRAVSTIINKLVHKSYGEGLLFIAESINGEFEYKMEESVCSFAGTLVLGAYTNPHGFDHQDTQRDLRVGKALAYTCYQMYARTKSGLSPESVTFNMEQKGSEETNNDKNHNNSMSITPNARSFNLHSSFVESLYILYTLTKDTTYQEWGWEIFVSIENYCRAGVAYATLSDVNYVETQEQNDIPHQRQMHMDQLDSRFISKTLKYLYLLFNDDDNNNNSINGNKNHFDIQKQHIFSAGGNVLKVLSDVEERKWGIYENIPTYQ